MDKMTSLTNQTDRQIGLDFVRVLLMILIFNFHASIHGGVDYGWLDNFVSQGAVAMEGFFILSGFCLARQYSSNMIDTGKELWSFYYKRAIRLLPLYWIVWIIKRLGTINVMSIQDILLIPFELFGITSAFDGTFSASQGDWFVSCMLFCYFCFPLLQVLISKLSDKSVKWLLVIFYVISSLAPVTASTCGFSWTYPNPFFRMLQFATGMMLVRLIERINMKSYTRIGISMICFVTLVFMVSFLHARDWGSYGSYEFITIPIWSILIILLANCILSDGIATKVVLHFSKISYAFYLMQFCCYRIALGLVLKIELNISLLSHNIMVLCVSFLICLIGAEVLTKVDEGISKMCKKVNVLNSR